MESRQSGRLVLLGAAHGLVSEADAVAAALDSTSPEIVLLALSVESLTALERHDGADVDESELPDAEQAYANALSRFGPVGVPPPDLVAALAWARAHDVPVEPVDLSEEEYETAFTANVSGWGLLRYSRRVRRLSKRPPAAATPEALARAWDADLRRVKGIAAVERVREEAIAERALERSAGRSAALVVDVARLDGVASRLRAR